MPVFFLKAAVRKVRAPQGRMPDNVRSGKPEDQCNRNIPPAFRGRRKAGKGEMAV